MLLLPENLAKAVAPQRLMPAFQILFDMCPMFSIFYSCWELAGIQASLKELGRNKNITEKGAAQKLMSEDQQYSRVSNENLLKKLDQLRYELHDLEQGRQFLMRRTGVRVSSTSLRLEATISNIKDVLQKIRGTLKKRGFGTSLLAKETWHEKT
jgi:uncharacterized protein (DUF488 family)